MSSDLVTCTFVQTGKKMELQDWYECLTCKAPARTGLCVSCAVVCHAGHKLSAVKNSKFYCDCGTGGFKARGVTCKCLTPTAKVVIEEPSTAGAVPTPTPTTANVVVATPTASTASTTSPVPTEDFMSKTIKTFQMSFVNPVSSAVSRKDVSSMTMNKAKLVEAFKDFTAKYSQYTEHIPIVCGFIKEIEGLLISVDSTIREVSVAKEIDAVSKDIIQYCKSLDTAIKSKNITSVQHNLGFLNQKYPPFEEKFGNYPHAASVIEQVTAIKIKYDTEFAAILADKEIDDQIAVLKPMVGYMETAIKTQNVQSAMNWLNQLKTKFPVFQSQYSAYPKSHSFIEFVNQAFVCADAQLSGVIAEKEISESIKIMAPMVKALKGALDREDSKSAIRWTTQLTSKLDDFKSKYSGYPESSRFIEETTELVLNANAAFFDMIQEEAINKALNELKPKVHALRGALSRKDVDSAATWKSQVTDKLNHFEQAFGSSPIAQSIIQNTKDVLAQCDAELGTALVDKQIAESIKIMTPMLQALEGGYSRKDVDSILRWKNALSSKFTPFSEVYTSQPTATSFITNVTSVFNKVNTEMGPIIAEKQMNEKLLILKPQISSLKGSFERTDVPAVINKKRQIEALREELVKAFPSIESHSNVKELDQLLSDINSSLGATILEKEIESTINTLSIAYKALIGALDRKSALSALNWKRQLETQLRPFEEKYGANPQSVKFVQDAKALIARVDTELASEITEQVTQQLNQMTLKKSQFDINSPIAAPVTNENGEEVVDDGQVQCPNKSNPRPKLKQNMYMCLTCTKSGATAFVCGSCRDVCHAEHKMGPMISVADKCDCEKFESDNGPCQCLEYRQFPRQEYQEVEWVKALGYPSNEDIKFIEYTFKYLKEIEKIFKELDDNNRERDLKRVNSLLDGIYSIGDQLGLNLKTGPLKHLVEDVIKPASLGNAQKLIPEFWSDLFTEAKRELGGVKTLNKDSFKTENDKIMFARGVYLQRYRLYEWGFLQATPKGRDFFNKYWNQNSQNHTFIQNPIPWYTQQPTEQEKEQVDQFWKKFTDITCDQVPQLSKVPEVEKLLEEGTTSLSKIRYFKEFQMYITDYISWMKYISSNNGERPQHLPRSFNNMFGHNQSADMALYSCYHREWDNFFHHLREMMNKYGKIPKSVKSEEEKIKCTRYYEYAQDFYNSSTGCLKSYAFPLIIKWELKGKLDQSNAIIKECNKNLSEDEDFKKIKSEFEAIRSRRAGVLNQLTESDNKFNDILRAASTAFQSTISDYTKKTSPKSYDSFVTEREIVPSISSFKGKEIIFESFRHNDPVQTTPFELTNGNWKLSWGSEIDGGDDFIKSQEISTQLSKTIHSKHQLDFNVSKKGSDALHKYLVKRSSSTKCSSDSTWTAVGTIKGLFNFTTHHHFTAYNEGWALQVPKDAVNVDVQKKVYRTISTSKYVGHVRYDFDQVEYMWCVKYSLNKVAVEVDIKAMKCDLFSALVGSKNSINGLHDKLKQVVPN